MGELFVNIMCVLGRLAGLDGLHHLALFHFLAGQHHGQEHAVLTLGGDHAVWGGGVVVNGVSLAQQLHVPAHLHLHGPGQDVVKFLAGVGGGVDGLVLQGWVVGIADEIRFRNLLAEHGGQVADVDALLPCRHLARAFAGDGVGGQHGAAAFQQVDHFHLEGQGALVQEGKGQVHLGVFIRPVGFLGHVGHPGHFRHGIPADFAQLPDTGGYLAHLVGDMLGLGYVHDCVPRFRLMGAAFVLPQRKARPKVFLL